MLYLLYPNNDNVVEHRLSSNSIIRHISRRGKRRFVRKIYHSRIYMKDDLHLTLGNVFVNEFRGIVAISRWSDSSLKIRGLLLENFSGKFGFYSIATPSTLLMYLKEFGYKWKGWANWSKTIFIFILNRSFYLLYFCKCTPRIFWLYITSAVLISRGFCQINMCYNLWF